ncbi:MAG: hypothetical protein AAB420_02240 [Patescibacteria group bacterium]
MISERQQKLLEKIIKEFVATAQPVSSKALEESGFLDVSSATIRSEMNELEKLGFLEQPHTSAGRIPSDKAYRFFVDNMVKQDDVTPKEKKRLDQAIEQSPRDPHFLNRAIAQALCELSDNLVIVNIRDQQDFFKIGLKSLFEMPEFQEIERVFRMTSLFEEFEQVFDQMMVDAHDQVGHVKILIGPETMLFAEYRLPQHHTGSVTLIGPTRMDYERNIALLNYLTNKMNHER